MALMLRHLHAFAVAAALQPWRTQSTAVIIKQNQNTQIWPDKK